MHDGYRLQDAWEEPTAREIPPRCLRADSHDGAEDKRFWAKAQGIDLVAPARPAKGKAAGRLTLEDFTLDEEG